MTREYWRLLIICATIVLALFYLYPTYQFYYAPPENLDQRERVKQQAINLGLDLQGGIHLVLEVDQTNLSEDEKTDVVARALEIIRNRIDQFGVSEPIIHREGDWRIVVELPGVQDIERAKGLIGKTARLEFKILKSDADRAGIIEKVDRHLAAQAPVDTAKAEDPLLGQIAEETPSLSRYMLSTRGDFVVPEDNILTVRDLLNRPDVQKLLPPDAQFLWNSKVEEMGDGQRYRALYYLKRRVEMTGEILSDASVTTGQSFENAGQPIVNFTTTSQGVRLFGRVTGANVGERMAIILDDQVYSAPTIRSKINQGSGIIEGTGTVDEAKDLAIVLRAGALPADVNIVEDRTVGPSLGRDSIEQGRNAALIGLVIVIIFMVIYYGFSGLVADLALVLNLVFVLAVLAAFQGTLTLPGIAGIILTIGMAVDANVLILERIREELRAEKTLRGSHRKWLCARRPDHRRCQRNHHHHSHRALPIRHRSHQGICTHPDDRYHLLDVHRHLCHAHRLRHHCLAPGQSPPQHRQAARIWRYQHQLSRCSTGRFHLVGCSHPVRPGIHHHQRRL